MKLSDVFKQVLTSEGDALKEAAKRIQEDQVLKLAKIYEWLRSTGGSLIISGVGKSGLIGQKIASTFSSLGLPSFFLHPTEALHGDLGRLTKSDVLCLISKSGSTEELLQLLNYISLPKNQIIALVGKTGSALANRADLVFDCSVEKEACLNDLAPTTSTTLTLAVGDAMAVIYESVMGVSAEKFALNHPAGLLGKSLSLTVDKLMIPYAECAQVDPAANLQKAILAMTQHPVGMCAIVEGRKLKGILVEGDIRRAFSKNEKAMQTPIKDLMTVEPVMVTSQTRALEAFKMMEKRKSPISVVPVVDNGEFQGVLRLHDLFKAGFSSSAEN